MSEVDANEAAAALLSMHAGDASDSGARGVQPPAHPDSEGTRDDGSPSEWVSDTESSDDEFCAMPVHKIPTMLYVIQYVTLMETRLARNLERCFAVLMDDINAQPVGVYMMGICAGGVLGMHPAAFSVGYVSMAIFSQQYRFACEVLAMCIGIHESLVGSAPAVYPIFCVGKELRRFLHSRRITPATAAALSVYTLGVLSPTLNILCVIGLKTVYDAFMPAHR
tara:strand:- start:3320 stop:3988 length:669 start_codon:yes stop_codon:yes gene_type:complete